MARIYLILFLLTGYCFYHAYKNDAPRYWFLIILVIPFFGAIGYMLYQFSQIDKLNTHKPQLGSKRKIEQLEKELELTDTIKNRILLADEYHKNQDLTMARQLYESCLSGHASEDLSTLIKLVDICFEEGRYKESIAYAEEINGKSLFDKSVEKTAYAWSLYKRGKIDEAEQVFKEMDARYSHYIQRLEFSKFYLMTNRPKAAREICRILLEEYESMHPHEQKQKEHIFRQIKDFFDSTS